jgi:hypothetical protein
MQTGRRAFVKWVPFGHRVIIEQTSMALFHKRLAARLVRSVVLPQYLRAKRARTLAKIIFD